jgi:hypothetical protein
MNLSKPLFQYFCLLVFMTYSLGINAQDTRNLDLIKGVSIFKFGTDSSDIKEKKLKSSSFPDSRHVVYYQYTGDSLKTIFNVPVSEVFLYYYKNQLFRIDLNFGTLSKEYTLQEYHQVQQQLEKLYGTDKVKLAMSGAVMLGGFRWQGEKVQVEHARHSYPPKRKKDNAIVGEISFSDINLTRQSALDKT